MIAVLMAMSLLVGLIGVTVAARPKPRPTRRRDAPAASEAPFRPALWRRLEG
jgi:hypothetical protein